MDFSQSQFVVAAARINQLPPDEGREVAFAGRSNAGKSSALNAISKRRALARVSKTPGRTQQLVVFQVSDSARLIDLPGYGYAKVPAAVMAQWHATLERYFTERQSLAGLVVIMDIRHPLKDYDREMLGFCRTRGLPVHVLLTKCDKLKRGPAMKVLQTVARELEAMGIEGQVQLFSSLDKTGVDEAREQIIAWLE